MTITGPFETLLKDKIGLDPASIGNANVLRAVNARAKVRAAGDLDAYWHEVVSSPQEQQALIQAVVVPETWFFRYPESLALAAKVARSNFLAFTSPSAVLRIVSVPCSSGEEPYSIAMALLDAGLPPERFVIDAVDISEREIDLAQRGRYGSNSFRGTDLAYRNRHFTGVANRLYDLSARVRAQVRFHCGNLLDPGLALTDAAYDLLFCRNLLIYFDVPTQEAGLHALLRLGHPGSSVFVGPAEASLLTRHRMRPIGEGRAFAFFMPQAATGTDPTSPHPAGAPVQPVPAPVRPPARSSARPNFPLPPPTPLASARPGRGAPLPAQAPVPAPTAGDAASKGRAADARTATATRASPAVSTANDRQADFARVIELADQGKVGAALESIMASVQRHGPSAQAFYLMGLCHDSLGDAVNAQTYYRKALYLDPRHAQALVHLAALLEGHGDAGAAERLRARAAREAARS